MKKKRFLLAVSLLLTTLLIFTACGTNVSKETDAGASADYVVRIGVDPGLCYAPIHMGIEKGFFEAEGVKIEPVDVDANYIMDTVAAGQIDAGCGLVAKFVQPLENGLPLKFTSGLHTGCVKIVARENSDIRSITDLKGKKVGVPSLAGAPTLVSKRALAREGIGVTSDNLEVEFVVYANTDLPSALANGAVDAIAGGDPSVTIASNQYGFITLLDTATDAQYQEEYCCLVFVTASLAEKHPELAKKITRAFMKASEWVSENLEETAKIQVEKGYVAGDVETNLEILRTYNYIPSVQGGYDALENAVNALHDIKLLKPETDTKKLIENSYIFFQD